MTWIISAFFTWTHYVTWWFIYRCMCVSLCYVHVKTFYTLQLLWSNLEPFPYIDYIQCFMGFIYIIMMAITDVSILLWFQVNQKNDEDNAKLVVPVSKRSDTGQYTIHLANKYGEDSGDINVIVLGRFLQKITITCNYSSYKV